MIACMTARNRRSSPDLGTLYITGGFMTVWVGVVAVIVIL
jgi:hypothetical protein